jgi:hypothetical protein
VKLTHIHNAPIIEANLTEMQKILEAVMGAIAHEESAVLHKGNLMIGFRLIKEEGE